MGNVTKRIMLKWNQLWENEEKKNHVKTMMSGINFFFTYKGDLYGGGESSRVTYAKMVDPEDEDHTPGWMKEASFSAVNLYKDLEGQKDQTIFTEKDISEINVITEKDQAEKMLMKKAANG